jgi:hypothetical protein
MNASPSPVAETAQDRSSAQVPTPMREVSPIRPPSWPVLPPVEVAAVRCPSRPGRPHPPSRPSPPLPLRRRAGPWSAAPAGERSGTSQLVPTPVLSDRQVPALPLRSALHVASVASPPAPHALDCEYHSRKSPLQRGAQPTIHFVTCRWVHMTLPPNILAALGGSQQIGKLNPAYPRHGLPVASSRTVL